jgi:hypothetical protein
MSHANREKGFLGRSIVPASGATLLDWPASGAIPESLSAGGWTYGNEGFPQQTFLGASIRSFTVNGGFGDSSSQLSVELVNDEYNTSDRTGAGFGDDPYHSGIHDFFAPPVVGSPVFFKFGKNHADIEQSWRKVYDQTYTYAYDSDALGNLKYRTYWGSPRQTIPTAPAIIQSTQGGKITAIPADGLYLDVEKTTARNDEFLEDPTDINATDNVWQDARNLWAPHYLGRGKNHFAFGGILQSYTQNRGPGGNPLYKVNVIDPREILANCEIVLNNYAGTTFNNKNMFNVYGFLEYNPTDSTKSALDAFYSIGPDSPHPLTGKSPVLSKYVDPVTGFFTYTGDDMYRRWPNWPVPVLTYSSEMLPNSFPITGTGFSRRSSKGIPYYRVNQAMTALLNYEGMLPKEYRNKGFGGHIDFRGFNYVVDFGGIPLEKIPPYYFLDFDQINLLELAQELCDVISHDLFVSLIPVIDHPAVEWLHEWNKDAAARGKPKEMVQGVIRVDAIDRSIQPKYGSIKKYIDDLDSRGIHVENSDVGFELSNITTDKFIVGAQETSMYYFNTNRDRDFLEVRKHKHGMSNRCSHLLAKQWMLDESLEQQVLPFYGFLGKNAVTIPRGWGAYQQILLDTTALNAHGVGNYYIATEIELRAAAVSYQRWKEFLLQYNDVYMESTEENDAVESQVLQATTAPPGEIRWSVGLVAGFPVPIPSYHKPRTVFPTLSHNYHVTVPRCVFRSDRNYMGGDGLPASPCNPPYGYPLYFQRATKIGIPEAGVVKISAAKTQIITNLASFSTTKNRQRFIKIHQSDWATGYKGWLEEAGLPIQLMRMALGDEAVIKAKMSFDAQNANKSLREYIDLKNREGRAIAARGWRNTIAFIERKINQNCSILKNVQRLGEESIENSTKVYQFLKGIADEHLGKSFLVKIPKRCNLSYSKHLSLKNHGSSTLGVGEVDTGPFGFKTQPINPELGYYFGSEHQLDLLMKRGVEIPAGETYLSSNHPYHTPPEDRSFTYGALKNNYNPIEEKYEFNYMPNGNGGYFDFEIYGNTMSPGDIALIPDQAKLPLATQYALCPKDLTNFMTDDGRINCYVRFDNSQFLNFNGVQSSDMSQEIITHNGHMIPDITEALDNMDEDQFVSLNSASRLNSLPKTVAYVKCGVDEQLYMPPKMVGIDPTMTEELTSAGTMLRGDSNPHGGGSPTLLPHPPQSVFTDYVFGRNVRDMPMYEKPRLIYDPDTCKYKPSYSFYTHHFIPHPANGGHDGTMVSQQDFHRRYDPILKGDIIDTSVNGLDPDHVYALIKVPGRVTPTIDSRMKDGPYQLYQGFLFKHYMTMDTVKGPVAGFEKPAAARMVPTNLLGKTCGAWSVDTLVQAFSAYETAMSKLSVASPEAQIHFTLPSPVYPDVVALPLMSTERCYGPWLSSAVDSQSARYAEIGGDVEFEKDEDLAPWNYAGYQLMHEAGKVKAQFSNSLLLFSERGGFVVPDAPNGNVLAKSLLDGGPLVTSISVNVGQRGVQTTYKMDLYTSRFGKLQKQKENIIAQVSREKKKMRDQRNALIRKGMGKAATGGNFGNVINQYGDVMRLAAQTNQLMSTMQKGESDPTWVVASVDADNDWWGYTKDENGAMDRLANGNDTGYKIGRKTSHSVAETFSLASTSRHHDNMVKRTYGGPEDNYLAPGSHDIYDPFAAYTGNAQAKHQASRHLYDLEDETLA